MNTSMKRMLFSESIIALGWPFVKQRIEIESVNFARGVLRSTLRRFERAGGHGRYSCAISLQFDFGNGMTQFIPEEYPFQSGQIQQVIFYCNWNLSLTELNGIPEGTAI